KRRRRWPLRHPRRPGVRSCGAAPKNRVNSRSGVSCTSVPSIWRSISSGPRGCSAGATDVLSLVRAIVALLGQDGLPPVGCGCLHPEDVRWLSCFNSLSCAAAPDLHQFLHTADNKQRRCFVLSCPSCPRRVRVFMSVSLSSAGPSLTIQGSSPS